MSRLTSLKPYVTKDQPFGPIDSGQIGSDDLGLLFEKQSRV